MAKQRQKPPKAYAKVAIVQARLDNAEFKIVHDKAVVYQKGNVSAFVREALLNYRPLKKAATK